jgi:serine/threonine protein phosphatase PrpC
MAHSGLSAPDAAAHLGNLALRLGSADNVTLLLVVFQEGEGAEEDGGVDGMKEEEEGEGG